MMNDELAYRLVVDDITDEEAEIWEILEGGVDVGHYKHDSTAYHSTFQHNPSGKIFVVNYISSYNYGIDDCSINWFEAERREKVVVTYVPVKKEGK